MPTIAQDTCCCYFIVIVFVARKLLWDAASGSYSDQGHFWVYKDGWVWEVTLGLEATRSYSECGFTSVAALRMLFWAWEALLGSYSKRGPFWDYRSIPLKSK